jgi:hypothetical protein
MGLRPSRSRSVMDKDQKAFELFAKEVAREVRKLFPKWDIKVGKLSYKKDYWSASLVCHRGRRRIRLSGKNKEFALFWFCGPALKIEVDNQESSLDLADPETTPRVIALEIRTLRILESKFWEGGK